jgi:GNAT superfamily N-acetyltransferase
MNPEIVLRQMESTDGESIAVLDMASPDSGSIAFSTLYLHDPYASIMTLHPEVVGVVATKRGRAGIVGMAMMSLGRCGYEREQRPYAYLFSLCVHPGYRRLGIASSLYEWLLQAAKGKAGEDVVVTAAIQGDNEASLKVAERWATHVDKSAMGLLAPMRKRRPKPVLGLEFREAEDDDWDEISEKQNYFYGSYNLYPMRSPSGLRSHYEALGFGQRIRSYHVALDAKRNIIAGIGALEEGSIEPLQVVGSPRALALANKFIRVLSPEGILRRLSLRDAWFSPGHETALARLWDSLRWTLRDRGSMMTTYVDSRGPLARAIPRPWYLPRTKDYTVLSASPSPSNDRLVYMNY